MTSPPATTDPTDQEAPVHDTDPRPDPITDAVAFQAWLERRMVAAATAMGTAPLLPDPSQFKKESRP